MSDITYRPCPKCGTEVSRLWEIGEVEGACDECTAEVFGVQVESVEYVTDPVWKGTGNWWRG